MSRDMDLDKLIEDMELQEELDELTKKEDLLTMLVPAEPIRPIRPNSDSKHELHLYKMRLEHYIKSKKARDIIENEYRKLNSTQLQKLIDDRKLIVQPEPRKTPCSSCNVQGKKQARLSKKQARRSKKQARRSKKQARRSKKQARRSKKQARRSKK